MSSCFSLSPELMASLIVLTSFKMAWASCCLYPYEALASLWSILNNIRILSKTE